MKNLFYLILFIAMASCKNSYQEPFLLDKNLDHLDNDEILKSKQNILNTLLEIDKWYQEINKEIYFVDSREIPSFHMYGINVVPDNIRLNYIKNEIIPGVEEYPLLTKGYREKIIERNQYLIEPGNLGNMMIEHDLGLQMWHLMVDYLPSFLLYLGYEDDLYSDNPDYTPDVPEITEKDAERYYFEMIRVSKNTATLIMDYGISNAKYTRLYGQYLVFALVKDKKGNWLLSNIQIFDKDEEGSLITFY